MDVREKSVELLNKANSACVGTDCFEGCKFYMENDCLYKLMADHLISNGVTVQEWISVSERLPQNFVSVLGYMTDAGEFPPVRECYTVGNAFFFPALGDVHPVSHWCELPQPPKGE